MIPPLTDNTFASGKLGFWTKSDAVSYFTDTSITYVPREVLARPLVREMVKKYPRLLGLKIFVRDDQGGARLIASKDETEIGTAGTQTEKDAITHGTIFYGRGKDTAAVVMPLRDRNGEPIAAVRVVLKPIIGQTEQNALIRARPIVKEMQARVQSLTDLTE